MTETTKSTQMRNKSTQMRNEPAAAGGRVPRRRTMTGGMVSLSALADQRSEPDEASSGPRTGDGSPQRRSGPVRQPRRLSVPQDLVDLLGTVRYNREDLLVRALDRHYDAARDRKLLRPVFPRAAGRPRPKLSMSTTAETWQRVTRLADHNGWSASATVTALLWHYLSYDDAETG